MNFTNFYFLEKKSLKLIIIFFTQSARNAKILKFLMTHLMKMGIVCGVKVQRKTIRFYVMIETIL